MTGRDLIVYILQNNLEDKPVYEKGRLVGFLSVPELALRLNVGFSTIKTWYELGVIEGIVIGNELFIPFTEKIDSIKAFKNFDK